MNPLLTAELIQMEHAQLVRRLRRNRHPDTVRATRILLRRRSAR